MTTQDYQKAALAIREARRAVWVGLGEPEIRHQPKMGYKDCRHEYLTGRSWIPVEEKLPEFDEYVIWLTEAGHQFVEHIDKDSDWETFSHQWTAGDPEHLLLPDPITHWAPLLPVPLDHPSLQPQDTKP